MQVTITISSNCEPTIHRTGCGHLARVRRQRFYVDEYTLDADTLTEASLDYWTDIIHSDLGLEGEAALDEAESYLDQFDIGPCVKLPAR